jgi:hypothetical protein
MRMPLRPIDERLRRRTGPATPRRPYAYIGLHKNDTPTAAAACGRDARLGHGHWNHGVRRLRTWERLLDVQRENLVYAVFRTARHRKASGGERLLIRLHAKLL